MSKVIVSPFERVESSLTWWPEFGHPRGSCLNEPFPSGVKETPPEYNEGDDCRWGEVQLAEGIAFREITWTSSVNGETRGELIVYGTLVGDKFKRGRHTAFPVTPTPPGDMGMVEDGVRAAHAVYLQGVGYRHVDSMSEALARRVAESIDVVFLADDGWTLACLADDEGGDEEV
ncbi:MAG: hypothetical protein U9Q03_01320 [Patescibacteria group bacterium]|nr:hypothetical protein [Patescibacteria group bacterium]